MLNPTQHVVKIANNLEDKGSIDGLIEYARMLNYPDPDIQEVENLDYVIASIAYLKQTTKSQVYSLLFN